MVGKETPMVAIAPDWDILTAVLGISADWAWEQNSDFCFTRMTGLVLEGDPEVASDQLLGSTRWDIGLQLVGEGQS